MNSKIEKTKVGWDEKIVMVCSTCAKQFPVNSPDDQDVAQRIKSELKAITKAEFGQSVRVVTASCLNICPDKKVAIAIADKNSPEVFSAVSVDPSISGIELFNALLKK